MASSDEEPEQEFYRGTKRRLQRACDFCRRKKTGCDGSPLSAAKCTPCMDANVDCTYVEAPVKRPPPKDYRDLSRRLEHAEGLVRNLRAELAKAHFAISSSNSVPSAALCVMRATLESLTAPPAAPQADDVLDSEIANKFEKLSMGTAETSFFGRASEGILANPALDLKPNADRIESSKPRFPDRSQMGEDTSKTDPVTRTSRRPQYWKCKSRDDAMRHTYTFKFPPNDHMSDLIDLYFVHENVYLPLLHRPTFARGVADGLHLRNDGFAGTLLLVCAIGSRWSTDPRIADPGFDCGWEWFDQVHLAGNSLLGSPTLYDLQQYCLAAQFLKASSMHQAWWTLIGVGLRLAQDLGVHRSKNSKSDSEVAPSPEWELQKRAFWILVYQDRLASSVFGHICPVSYLGFDTDLPLQVDDEHWDHPTHPFQQPAHTPSRVTFFNALMGLNHILGLSLQILYAPQTVRTSFSINGDWEAQAIAELDSALNVWRDRIPEHLRWDPMRGDTVFFDQSVALYCSFYYVQIMIHRPFISVLRRSPTALPSLTICTTAARACANAVDVQRQRGGDVARPHNLNAVFMAGLVLLLHISSDERSSSGREMTHVQKCMDAVRLCEGRWQGAGMLWDALAEMAAAGGQLPLLNTAPPTTTEPDWDYRRGSDMGGLLSPPADDTSSYPPQFHATYPYPRMPSSVLPSGRGVSTHTGVGPSFTPARRGDESPSRNTYTDPTQASRELASMIPSIDRELANAPMGLGLDDWGGYFSNFP